MIVYDTEFRAASRTAGIDAFSPGADAVLLGNAAVTAWRQRA